MTNQKKWVVTKEKKLRRMNLKIIELTGQKSQKLILGILIQTITIVKLQIEIPEKIEEEV